jgi:hypothetical protein
VHLDVQATSRSFHVAVDVDSKSSTAGVQWKTLTVSAADLGPAATFPEGFTDLASTPGSGALDHIRHRSIRLLSITIPKLLARPPLTVNGIRLPAPVGPALGKLGTLLRFRPWRSGDYQAASTALEGTLAIGAQTLVWGDPFPNGPAATTTVQGVHNVHQNQGDPAGSQWWPENGIWQDGGVASKQPDGRWRLFVSKFSTQALATDDDGHPT